MFNKDKWYIFLCDNVPMAWGLLHVGSYIGSNCPEREWFDTEEAYLLRCEELGIQIEDENNQV